VFVQSHIIKDIENNDGIYQIKTREVCNFTAIRRFEPDIVDYYIWFKLRIYYLLWVTDVYNYKLYAEYVFKIETDRSRHCSIVFKSTILIDHLCDERIYRALYTTKQN